MKEKENLHFLIVIEANIVIGWFKLQLWLWLAYWMIWSQTVW